MHGNKLIAAVLLVFTAARGMTQEHQHGNGEKLGEVHFATSCNEPAQSDFNRAVALLHSFQFSRAIDGFNAVLREDPTCAIAYWGIALSDWGNPFAPGTIDVRLLQLGRENAERGERRGAKTDRERGYLAAVGNLYSDFESTPQQARLLAYRDAMGEVAAKYPDDHEAQDLLRIGARGRSGSRRQDLRRPTQGGNNSREIVRGGADASRFGTLHHPCVRRAGAGGPGPSRGATLRGNCPRCASRAAHAVAYIHPLGILAGVD